MSSNDDRILRVSTDAVPTIRDGAAFAEAIERELRDRAFGPGPDPLVTAIAREIQRRIDAGTGQR